MNRSLARHRAARSAWSRSSRCSATAARAGARASTERRQPEHAEPLIELVVAHARVARCDRRHRTCSARTWSVELTQRRSGDAAPRHGAGFLGTFPSMKNWGVRGFVVVRLLVVALCASPSSGPRRGEAGAQPRAHTIGLGVGAAICSSGVRAGEDRLRDARLDHERPRVGAHGRTHGRRARDHHGLGARRLRRHAREPHLQRAARLHRTTRARSDETAGRDDIRLSGSERAARVRRARARLRLASRSRSAVAKREPPPGRARAARSTCRSSAAAGSRSTSLRGQPVLRRLLGHLVPAVRARDPRAERAPGRSFARTGVRILAISIDTLPPEELARWVAEHGIAVSGRAGGDRPRHRLRRRRISVSRPGRAATARCSSGSSRASTIATSCGRCSRRHAARVAQAHARGASISPGRPEAEARAHETRRDRAALREGRDHRRTRLAANARCTSYAAATC